MDQRVVDAVRGHEGIDDWTIRFQHGRGAQVYLAGTAVENVRQVGRELGVTRCGEAKYPI